MMLLHDFQRLRTTRRPHRLAGRSWLKLLQLLRLPAGRSWLQHMQHTYGGQMSRADL